MIGANRELHQGLWCHFLTRNWERRAASWVQNALDDVAGNICQALSLGGNLHGIAARES